MSKNKIKWKRSEDGYVESHDDRWMVNPLWMGTTRAQAYELRDCKDGGYERCGSHDTQKAAKEYAQEIVDSEDDGWDGREILGTSHACGYID